ncbi:MAG TPA: GNAT family N-acetyltransferase [Terriglobia bacterium]|nr:GNAT family N-acetyltransferase [Terriglobia bacterium]
MTAEIIDIRHFEAKDFAPLLEAESAAWFKTLRWDYTPSARLISACLADKRLSGYALVNGGKIEGYSFFLYEGEKGLIGDLFVQPSSEMLENAVSLLEHVIETLKATPGVRRVEAQLPHFSLVELDACFSRHRFESYLRRFMSRRIEAPEVEHKPDGWDKEFEIEPWQKKHNHEAARLLCRAYRSHVDARINDQYASTGGTAHLIENIVHLRGCGEHLPQASFAAIHRASRKLAGIIALTAVRAATAHVPQVAVDVEFQNRHVGAALMEVSFREAAKLGFQEVTLTVTDANRGAVRFYDHLGFETFQTFGAYVWNRSAA